MPPEVARAQIDTLLEWANGHERDGIEGSSEVAFLLRRAATMIGKIAGVPVTLPPGALDERLPKPAEGAVREG